VAGEVIGGSELIRRRRWIEDRGIEAELDDASHVRGRAELDGRASQILRDGRHHGRAGQRAVGPAAMHRRLARSHEDIRAPHRDHVRMEAGQPGRPAVPRQIVGVKDIRLDAAQQQLEPQRRDHRPEPANVGPRPGSIGVDGDPRVQTRLQRNRPGEDEVDPMAPFREEPDPAARVDAVRVGDEGQRQRLGCRNLRRRGRGLGGWHRPIVSHGP
jgi:hypothetical protein